MRRFYCLLMPVVLLCASCGNSLLPPLQVNAVSVEQNKIHITFSSEPDRNSIIDAFSLTEDNTPLQGIFSFSENEAFFTPVTGIRDGYDYILTINAAAENIKGESLLSDYIYKFTTKKESSAPSIISVTPANQSSVTEAITELHFTFSKPVTPQSFSEAFSLSPAADNHFVWTADNSEVSVVFEKELKKNTRYTVKISTVLHDTDNNTLVRSFSSVFVNMPDIESPVYSISWKTESANGMIVPSSATENIPLSSQLILSFSEQIITDSLTSFISFKPSLGMTIEPDSETKKSAVITFTEKPEWGKLYTLQINKGIKDTAGNQTEETSDFNLVFNREADRPVSFITGLFSTGSGSWFSIGSTNSYADMNLPVETFKTIESVSVPFYLAFRISSDSPAINLISIMKNMSIDTTNSCASFHIKKMQILTKAEYESSEIKDITLTQEDTSEWNICIVKCIVEVQNEDNRGLIRFCFDSNISDTAGNKLNKDLIFTYNKT